MCFIVQVYWNRMMREQDAYYAYKRAIISLNMICVYSIVIVVVEFRLKINAIIIIN